MPRSAESPSCHSPHRPQPRHLWREPLDARLRLAAREPCVEIPGAPGAQADAPAASQQAARQAGIGEIFHILFPRPCSPSPRLSPSLATVTADFSHLFPRPRSPVAAATVPSCPPLPTAVQAIQPAQGQSLLSPSVPVPIPSPSLDSLVHRPCTPAAWQEAIASAATRSIAVTSRPACCLARLLRGSEHGLQYEALWDLIRPAVISLAQEAHLSWALRVLALREEACVESWQMSAVIDSQFGLALLNTGQPALIDALYHAAPRQACQVRPLSILMRQLYNEGEHRRAIAIYDLMAPHLSPADRMSLGRFAAEHLRHVKDYTRALTLAREISSCASSSLDAREHARLIELYCLKCLWRQQGPAFLAEGDRALVRAWLRGDEGCRLTQSSSSYLRWQAWRVFVSDDGLRDMNITLPLTAWQRVAHELHEGLGEGNPRLQADVRNALEYLQQKMGQGAPASPCHSKTVFPSTASCG